MQSVPALPADPGLRTMVIFACIGMMALITGTLVGAVRKDRSLLRTAGIPLLLLTITLALGKRAQGFHVYIMASIAALTAWGAYKQKTGGRWFPLVGAIGLSGAVCCALLLF